MAEITSPEAVRWTNEVVRPLAERARALKAEVDAATVAWYAGLNVAIPNTADVIADGREAEGVSRLKGSDVHGFLAQVIGGVGGLNEQIVSLPCVRPLRVPTE